MKRDAASGLRRRFSRDRRGATAIEFAILALPFIFTMLAILEYGYVYLITASLDNATAIASRQIRTGQAQTATTPDPNNANASVSAPMTATQFKSRICQNMAWAPCDSVQVSAQPETGYAGQTFDNPVSNCTLRSNQTWQMGTPNQIVLIHTYYVWQMITPVLWMAPNRLCGNQVLLTASSLIKNEPYS